MKAVERGVDQGGGLTGPGLQRHPIAGGGARDIGGGLHQRPGRPGVDLTQLGDQTIAAALLHDNPTGHEALGGVHGKVVPERFAPAIGGQQWDCP
jgi:hypothetical protein